MIKQQVPDSTHPYQWRTSLYAPASRTCWMTIENRLRRCRPCRLEVAAAGCGGKTKLNRLSSESEMSSSVSLGSGVMRGRCWDDSDTEGAGLQGRRSASRDILCANWQTIISNTVDYNTAGRHQDAECLWHTMWRFLFTLRRDIWWFGTLFSSHTYYLVHFTKHELR